MARGRGHDAQLRERLKRSLGGGAAAAFAFLAEIAVEQQRDIAMVAEQDVCIADQLGQDRARVAVPCFPQPGAVIAVERDRDIPLCCGAGRGERACGGPRPQDRKSVVSGKSVSVRVDLGGCRNIKKKKKKSTISKWKYK